MKERTRINNIQPNNKGWEMPRQYSLAIAQEYSVYHSIMLCYYDFWCTNNELVQNPNAYHDGEYWCYQSARKLEAGMDYVISHVAAIKFRNELVEFGLLMEKEIRLGNTLVKTHRLTLLGKKKMANDHWWILKNVEKYIESKKPKQENENQENENQENEPSSDEDFYDYMPTKFGGTN